MFKHQIQSKLLKEKYKINKVSHQINKDQSLQENNFKMEEVYLITTFKNNRLYILFLDYVAEQWILLLLLLLKNSIVIKRSVENAMQLYHLKPQIAERENVDTVINLDLKRNQRIDPKLFKQSINISHIIQSLYNLKMPPKFVSSKTETVKVVVRCRPLNKDEKNDTQKHQNIVKVDEDVRRITVQNINKDKQHLGPFRDFTFDSVFGQTSKQATIFEDSAMPIIESVLEGYNGTIFAYGQTGTGKTFTMQGQDQPEQLRGIVPRAIHYIFNAIEGAATTKKYLVRTSFLQLYNEKLIDLLTNPQKDKKDEKKKLQIHEKPGQGIKVVGLTQFVIQNAKQISNKYNIGKKHRKVAETKMNAESSRSHSIFSIIIQNQEEIDGKMMTRAGKLNLVDLAGSERQSKTGVSGQQREQAININLSLTTLGLVIQNLVNPKATHIPYRDSQLTRMLQDSLGGNTKTVMIANIGPSSFNHDETISTLKYANRAKNIKNDVHLNEDPKDALLRQFQEEIKRLKEQVANSLGGVKGAQYIQKIVQEDDVEQFQEKLRLEQQNIKKKFDEEKSQVYRKKNMLQQQKNKLIKAIEEKQRQQALFKQNQEALIKKLKKMEEKVLTGKEEEQAAIQKAEILKKRLKELEKQRENQRIMQQDLKSKEQNIATMEKKYKSLQQENDDKTAQIKQKMRRLKNLANQNKQLQEMYAKQIEALQERRRILQKQLKLKNFIIDYFVPSSYIEIINSKVAWSDQHDDWVLPNLEISGNAVRHKLHQLGNKVTAEQMGLQYDQQYQQQLKINELCKIQLDSHPNVYYSYNEQGLIRELRPELNGQKPKKDKKKRPASKRKV